MTKYVLIALSLVAILSVVMAPTLLMSGSADSKDNSKTFTCDTAKNCKAIFNRVNGKVIIYFTNSAPPSGGGGTVDQVARDGLAELRTLSGQLQSDVNTNAGGLSELKTNVSQVWNEINIIKDRLSLIADNLNNLTGQNPILDINVTNGTTTGGTTNETGNQTGGGGGTNETGGGGGGTNQTGGGGTNQTGTNSTNSSGIAPASLNFDPTKNPIITFVRSKR